jgi:hypothetical protein
VTLRALRIASNLRLPSLRQQGFIRWLVCRTDATADNCDALAELGLLTNLCAAVLRPCPVPGNASPIAYTTRRESSDDDDAFYLFLQKQQIEYRAARRMVRDSHTARPSAQQGLHEFAENHTRRLLAD